MNDNYMKTILSGVKEWTENLTDDAKDKANNALDKANNALDKANNALDKALYVVNITNNSDGTFSADKTFEEITQAYNEGKYSIVLKYGFEEGEVFEYSFLRLDVINPAWAHFISPYHMGTFDNTGVATVFIYKNNTIKLTDTKLAQVPNPYPLTFTGAVNETYDGSSAKTIAIPSGGGGGAAWHEIGKQEFDGTESAVEFACSGESLLVMTIDHTEGISSVIVTLEHADGKINNMNKHVPTSNSYTPKMSFIIFGGTQDRGMISIKGESQQYNGGIAGATIEQGFKTVNSPDGAIERVSQSALVKITVTFNAAPKSGAAISLEGI